MLSAQVFIADSELTAVAIETRRAWPENSDYKAYSMVRGCQEQVSTWQPKTLLQK